MSKLREIFNVSSFSEIVNHKQPDETCPMIDSHISDLMSDIEKWRREIEGLEEQIEEEENSEEPSDYTISSCRNKISDLQDKIYEYEDKIKDLEEDRRTINDARKRGLASRTYALMLLDESIFERNGRLYFNIKHFSKAAGGDNLSVFRHLHCDYKDVNNNYQRIKEWAVAWDNSVDDFISAAPSSTIQLDLEEEEQEQFFSILSKLESYLTTGDGLNREDISLLSTLFPQAIYKGIGFKAEKGYNKRGQDDGEYITALDMGYIWENFCPYLDVPTIQLIPIED